MDNSNKDNIIKINVGGKIYMTTLNLICRYKSSYLYEIILDNYNKEEIFIDRNGNRFEYILDFLRDGVLICENDINVLTKILIEAIYFKLFNLVKIIKKKICVLYSNIDNNISKKIFKGIFNTIEKKKKKKGYMEEACKLRKLSESIYEFNEMKCFNVKRRKKSSINISDNMIKIDNTLKKEKKKEKRKKKKKKPYTDEEEYNEDKIDDAKYKKDLMDDSKYKDNIMDDSKCKDTIMDDSKYNDSLIDDEKYKEKDGYNKEGEHKNNQNNMNKEIPDYINSGPVNISERKNCIESYNNMCVSDDTQYINVDNMYKERNNRNITYGEPNKIINNDNIYISNRNNTIDYNITNSFINNKEQINDNKICTPSKNMMINKKKDNFLPFPNVKLKNVDNKYVSFSERNNIFFYNNSENLSCNKQDILHENFSRTPNKCNIMNYQNYGNYTREANYNNNNNNNNNNNTTNSSNDILVYSEIDDVEETSPFPIVSNVNLGEQIFSTTVDF
ncbi:conserved Plasmodium protein, unknown function [Plasmodium reichenowi]|uniref:BTB domain-containing protein n=1 Tax=Plasmodium reichenowi TaxID=5854 RepID=A0A2P9DIH6_PLARE|nr:conserved Plasmodium protein, unknown function [Plasmodium reichenowi]